MTTVGVLHPPKTAGRSLRAALERVGYTVVPEAKQWHRRADQIVAPHFVVVIRHPLSRAVSMFQEFFVRRSKGDRSVLDSPTAFYNWVTTPISRSVGSGTNIKASIFDYVVGAKSPVTYIRFDRFAEDFRRMIGIEIDLPHIGEASYAPWETYYDDVTRDAVLRLYRKDLELYNHVSEVYG